MSDHGLLPSRASWCLVILLALLGIAAAVGRGVYVPDFTRRLETSRRMTLEVLHRSDARSGERHQEFERFDSRFAAHPLLTVLHVCPGALFLALAPLQFVPRIRERHVSLHRWFGRVLIAAGFITASSGLYFGLLVPFGGVAESIGVALFGGIFLVALSLAFVAIRKRQIARHREWMTRAFAIAIGISTTRVIGFLSDIAFAPFGLPLQDIFVFSIWLGWGLTLGTAEAWIRRARRTLSLSPETAAVRG